ncbi:MAG TPA: cation:proton antiporter [Gemmatimonadaceae bacterium]|nr:cation:proton antiporter [Gemmatimonadaceae bacterium]
MVVASLLSGALERSGLPLVAVFLALGALLGPYGLGLVDIGFESPALHALAMLGLALVLFSDAVTIDLKKVRAEKHLLWRLLGPGTLIPAALVAVAARLLLDTSWPASAILGAALASTDPVLLRSAFRSGALPETARTALRIETGMNDVVLLPIVVLSILAMSDAASGHAVENKDIARSLVGLFLLGPALGGIVGYFGIIVLEQIRSRVGVRRDYESLYALGLAFSGFALAESVGGSGFLAAFAAGLMVSSQDVELCDCFLEYGEATAEMLLLLTFVALGTSLIWRGFEVFNWRTLVFTIVALAARTIVLYPVLKHTHTNMHERRIIAAFGPRGLSSLLLTLLPVFAGIPYAGQLFMVTSLVVLCSIVIHGGGITIFLRRHMSQSPLPIEDLNIDKAPVGAQLTAGAPSRKSLPIAEEAAAEEKEKITIDEMLGLKERGEEVIVVDARADRSFRKDELKASGSVRLDPDHVVRDAKSLKLSQNATLVLYCA